jgi:predicted dehydrogenase
LARHFNQPRRSNVMLKVGIIGFGPAWESRYLPALHRLGDRIQPRAVFDVVRTRGELIAKGLQAHFIDGVHALISRKDIDAILMFDADWHADVPLHFACRYRKPVFIAGSLGADLPRIEVLEKITSTHGIDMMPELSRRYTPATLRFRELIATSLGRVRRLRVELTLPSSTSRTQVPGQSNELDVLVGLVDWCRSVIGLPPESISSRVVTPSPAQRASVTRTRQVDLKFSRSATDGESSRAEIRLHIPGAEVSPTESDMTLHCQADCANGHATLVGSDQLQWRIGPRHSCESLSLERSEVEMMLDHFTRRVLGGLIPTPNLDDVCQSLAWVQAVAHATDREVTAACLLRKPQAK